MSFMDEAREVLKGDDAVEKANTLWAMSAASDVPDDVLELIRRHLDDHSVVRMYISFRYGEIRYLAAEMYAKLLFQRGRVEPLVLPKAIVPIKSEKLIKIRMAAGLPDGPPNKNSLDWFVELRDRGLLEVVDEIFDRSYFDTDE